MKQIYRYIFNIFKIIMLIFVIKCITNHCHIIVVLFLLLYLACDIRA